MKLHSKFQSFVCYLSNINPHYHECHLLSFKHILFGHFINLNFDHHFVINRIILFIENIVYLFMKLFKILWLMFIMFCEFQSILLIILLFILFIQWSLKHLHFYRILTFNLMLFFSFIKSISSMIIRLHWLVMNQG